MTESNSPIRLPGVWKTTRQRAVAALWVAAAEVPIRPIAVMVKAAHAVKPARRLMSHSSRWRSWLPIATEPLNNLFWALRGDFDHGPHRVCERQPRHV